jgi:hypothetical protein
MRTPAQLQMIVWTLVAVVLTGVGVFASLLQPPSTLNQKHFARHETKIEVARVDSREPASVGPQFSALAIDDKGSQAIDFTLPCDGNGRFSKNVVQVRLSGGLCLKTREIIEVSEIRNVTNGFSATVFPGPKRDTFTTDYITLADGENHIRIQHILKSGGKVERDFVIERH